MLFANEYRGVESGMSACARESGTLLHAVGKVYWKSIHIIISARTLFTSPGSGPSRSKESVDALLVHPTHAIAEDLVIESFVAVVQFPSLETRIRRLRA